jgi:hypothetical protein
MKGSTFWDITLCSLLKVNRRFGGTCHFYFLGGSIQSGNEHEADYTVLYPRRQNSS